MEPALGRRLFLAAVLLGTGIATVHSVELWGAAGTRSYSTFVGVTAVLVVLLTLAVQGRRGA